VVTTTRVKAGLLNSARRLYRKSCQKVSITYDGSKAPQAESRHDQCCSIQKD
jgi:hypothetical protein